MRGVKVDGLLYQAQAKRLGIKVNVLLWVSSNSGHVVNAVWIDAQVSPGVWSLNLIVNQPAIPFISELPKLPKPANLIEFQELAT
jgi:anaerobic selenocysteine-containing dehydrogenase